MLVRKTKTEMVLAHGSTQEEAGAGMLGRGEDAHGKAEVERGGDKRGMFGRQGRLGKDTGQEKGVGFQGKTGPMRMEIGFNNMDE